MHPMTPSIGSDSLSSVSSVSSVSSRPSDGEGAEDVRAWQVLRVAHPGGDPHEDPWRISAGLLPWEPAFGGVVVDAIVGVDEGVTHASDRSPLGRSTDDEIVGVLVMGAFTIVLGLVEVVLLAVVWPFWWAVRRLTRRPLDLTIRDPRGEWVMVPPDLAARSIRARRTELAGRILDGSLSPAPLRAEREGLSWAGPGEPLTRRRRPRRRRDGGR